MLVVATPCPLILAVPVALVAGLSRAARQGILVKGGGCARGDGAGRGAGARQDRDPDRGQPELVAIEAAGDLAGDEVLRLAASLDQASKHPVAATIVAEARARGLALSVPSAVAEVPGEGVEGSRGGSAGPGGRAGVRGGAARGARDALASPAPGALSVSVGVDGAHAGELILADALRAGTGALLAGLRAGGIRRLVLATGDRADVARRGDQRTWASTRCAPTSRPRKRSGWCSTSAGTAR